jgi:hypothetical protein
MESHGLRISFRRCAFGVLFALIPSLILGSAGFVTLTAPTRAFAQDANATRIVQGKVVDKAGAGLKGATVYLKDSHTLAVKSYIATDDGSYRFGQLAQNVDYELWAESGGKKSSTRNISSFDTRKEFDITLKIDK